MTSSYLTSTGFHHEMLISVLQELAFELFVKTSRLRAESQWGVRLLGP